MNFDANSSEGGTIDELSDQLTRANLVIVTDYRGLKVGDLQTLRGNLRPSGAEIHIARTR